MTATMIEHGQYVDDAGKPIVGGKVYIGLNGSDPVATSPVVTIYGDRELTSPIANPQTTGEDGRALNKIWVDGEYSIQVNSVVGEVETQEFQDLDAGSGSSTLSTLKMTNVQGVNNISGTTTAALSTIPANQQFIFTTVGANTGSVSLNVDGTGLRPIVKNHTHNVLPGEFEDDQVVIVAYNAVNNNFEWVNQNNKVVDFYVGTPVESASTTDIWVTDGNFLRISGTETINSFGTAPMAGAVRNIEFNSSLTVVNSANLALQGEKNHVTEAGDRMTVYAVSTTQFDVLVHKKNGEAITETYQMTQEAVQSTASGTQVTFTGIPAGVKEIEVCFDAVKLTGAEPVLVQLGTSSGVETTGYDAAGGHSAGEVGSTSGFVLIRTVDTNEVSGNLRLVLMAAGNNRWVGSVGGLRSASGAIFGGGIKPLSDTITQVRVLAGGADSFDGGSVSILYR